MKYNRCEKQTSYCLKKNMNASRSSEHPPVRGIVTEAPTSAPVIGRVLAVVMVRMASSGLRRKPPSFFGALRDGTLHIIVYLPWHETTRNRKEDDTRNITAGPVSDKCRGRIKLQYSLPSVICVDRENPWGRIYGIESQRVDPFLRDFRIVNSHSGNHARESFRVKVRVTGYTR